MPNPPPAWVQALTPAEPQGTQLLAQERAQSNIDVNKLGELLHTKEALDKQNSILSVLKSEKVFDKSRNHTLGRTEKIQLALARGKRLQQLKKVHGWSDEDAYVANELLAEPTPYGLHASMFLVILPGRITDHRLTSGR
jgi:acyl-CoA oxidase